MTKSYIYIISAILLLFVSFFTMLCWHSRLATDDYWYIWDVRHQGVLNSVREQYFEWCGRYAATFLRDVIYKYLQVNQTCYFLFPLLSFTFLIVGAFKILTGISNYLEIKLRRAQKTIASISFVALLFFLSLEIGETWFWYDGLSDYLLSILAFVWGISFLFDSRHSLISYVGIICCFTYVGGASEVYSTILVVLLTLCLIYQYRKAGNYKAFISSAFNKKLVVVYAILILSSIITIIAPGNYLRAELLPPRRFFYSLFVTSKSIVKFCVIYLPLRLPYIIVFATPFIFIGRNIQETNPTLFAMKFKTLFVKLSILFALIALLFFFIVAYLMTETGPARVWFLISFLFTIYSILIFFYIGYTNLFKSNVLIIKGSLVLGICLMLFNIIYQYPIVSKYSIAHDKRIEYLMMLNKTIQKDTLIKLNPLPPCGMLYADEIRKDTTYFTNQELRMGYNLNFHVALDSQNNE